jgi:hypothetical protein
MTLQGPFFGMGTTVSLEFRQGIAPWCSKQGIDALRCVIGPEPETHQLTGPVTDLLLEQLNIKLASCIVELVEEARHGAG